MQTFELRVRQIETLLGASLPSECVELLQRKAPNNSGPMEIPVQGDLWEISFFYELSDGKATRQLDSTLQRVHDVLPPHTLPIATDPGGNFFCLFVKGPQQGEVVFWDHERDRGDHETERVSESLSSFLASIQQKNDD